MGGRRYQIRKYCGPILYMKSSGKTLETEPHPSVKKKKTIPWLERKRKGKGRNPNPKEILVKGARINTCPKSSAFTVMNWDTIPWSFHTRRQGIIPQEERQVNL